MTDIEERVMLHGGNIEEIKIEIEDIDIKSTVLSEELPLCYAKEEPVLAVENLNNKNMDLNFDQALEKISVEKEEKKSSIMFKRYVSFLYYLHL